MAIKFERVKAGDVLYDCHRTKMGNTTMSQWSLYEVRVVSIDHDNGEAMASWNSNPARHYSRHQIERLSRNVPKAYREQQERRAARGGGW